MYTQLYLSRISFKSIFKLLLIPSFFFFACFYTVNNNSEIFIEKVNTYKQEMSKDDPFYEHLSEKKISESTTKYMLIGIFGFNLICSLWVWLCLRIYFLIFRLKIKANVTPVAHDQTVAPADEPPQAPDKTELG